MKGSIFERIYSSHERANQNARENFLTEIFAFCLETDSVFFSSWCEILEIPKTLNYEIRTQVYYEGKGRPDIEISMNDGTDRILIECKIDHFERENQLTDYAEILLQRQLENKHLVYLTRYYEAKELNATEVNLHMIRWSDIYNMISTDNAEITNQLNQYIKDQSMEDSGNFNYHDISVLLGVDDVISKMDEVLNASIGHANKLLKVKFSGYSSRSSRMQDQMTYAEYKDVYLEEKYMFGLIIGFYWWFEDKEDVKVGMHIWVPNDENKHRSKLSYTLQEELPDFICEEWDGGNGHVFQKPLAEFIMKDKDQIPLLIEYLNSGIDKVHGFLGSYSIEGSVS